jgi:hypothetical protein
LILDEIHQQDRLVSIIVGDVEIKGTRTLQAASSWYCLFLRNKFNAHWHLLARALVGLSDNSLAPAPGDPVVVYNFVIAVAELLKKRKDLTLVDIVDELYNVNLLKIQLDEERAAPNQIIFAAVGWLSAYLQSREQYLS